MESRVFFHSFLLRLWCCNTLALVAVRHWATPEDSYANFFWATGGKNLLAWTVHLNNTQSRPINHLPVHRLLLLLLPAISVPGLLELVATVWEEEGSGEDGFTACLSPINHFRLDIIFKVLENFCPSSDSKIEMFEKIAFTLYRICFFFRDTVCFAVSITFSIHS